VRLHPFLALGSRSGLRGGKLLLSLLDLLDDGLLVRIGPAMLASGSTSATAASDATNSLVIMFISRSFLGGFVDR
jgi:hypothetical protein